MMVILAPTRSRVRHQDTVVWGLRDDTLTLHLEPYGNLDPPQRYGLDGVVLVSPGGTSAVRRCAGYSAKV